MKRHSISEKRRHKLLPFLVELRQQPFENYLALHLVGPCNNLYNNIVENYFLLFYSGLLHLHVKMTKMGMW